ncbi:hypothetical protein BDF19DRAFT_19464 [Syncephalis fuscata]|nr:hypothetical protein BDF19DRAFT_19464 [Syncephalis fuscata]
MQKALDQKISHKQFIDTSHNVLLPALYEEQKRARSTMQFTAEWLIRWLDVLILRVEQPDWPETVQWFIQYLLPGTIQMDMQEEESISIKRQSGIRSIKLEDSLKLLYANEDGESTLHWPQAFYAITIIGDFVVELPPALYDFQCQLVKRLIAVHGYCVTKMQSHWPAQTSTPAFSSTLSTSPLSIFTFPPSCSILWPSLMERVSPILTIQERRHFRLKDTCQ